MSELEPDLDTTIKIVNKYKIPIMTNNNAADLNLFKFCINEEYSEANIKVEEVDIEGKPKTEIIEETHDYPNMDYKQLLHLEQLATIKVEEQDYDEQDIIKTETKVVGVSYDYLYTGTNKLLKNENEDTNLEHGNVAEHLLNENFGVKYFEGHPKIGKKINNLSPIHQEAGGNKKISENIGLDEEKNVLQQGLNLIEHIEINNKEAKENFTFTAEKLYKCNECSYAAVRKFDLVRHNKHRHTMDKPYKCDECTYAAVRKSDLLSHIRHRHTMEKLYKCDECPYATERKSDLLAHIKQCHAVEKPHKCDKCSYAAVRKYNLLSHIKQCHTMEKPHKCDECSYAALRKSDLLAHIKQRHTMEKPYKCDECSYAGVRKSYLQSHIKLRHSMEKRYQCNECSYAAGRNWDLLLHMKHRHTMEKLYKCYECSYAAVRKSNLLSHIQQHHTMEKPNKCDECSYATIRRSHLLRHIKRHHTTDKS